MKNVVIALCLFSPSLVLGGYEDLDPKTCEPSGIVAKLKEKSNSRAFWAEAHSDSDRVIELYTKGNPEIDAPHTVRDCEISYRYDQKEKHKCIWRIQR